jgi:type I restriction enzyme, S subunit
VSQPLKAGAWNIPPNWTWIDIASVAETTSGGTPRRDRPEYYGGHIPWLKSGELRDRTVFEVEEYITDAGLQNSSAKIFPPGTLCIALYGATVGKLAILGLSSATNQAICGIFTPAGINARFLFRFFELIRAELIELGKGGAQPNISQGIVRSTFFPLAPSNEQGRIVAEIDRQFTRLDAAVTALKRVQANLKRYRAAVLKAACEGRLVPTEAELARKEGRSYETGEQLLVRILKERRAKWEADQLAKMHASGKPLKNDDWKKKYKEPIAPDTTNLPMPPEGWASTTMPTLGELNRGKSKHRPRNDPRLLGGPYPFIQTGDVKHSGGLIRNHDQTYTEFGLRQSRLWPEGTLCITIAANIAETGILTYAACFPDSIVGFCSDSLVTVRFLELFLRTAKQELARFAPATAQKNINLEVLNEVAIPLPPIAEQERIVAEVDRRLSLLAEIDAELQHDRLRADRLHQSMLKRAFEGKLVPQDSSDEPASVLLDRIRAERARAIQETKRFQPKRKIKAAVEVL